LHRWGDWFADRGRIVVIGPNRKSSLAQTTSSRQSCVQALVVSVRLAELKAQPPEVKRMLWTIFVILLVLWLLGVVSSYTLGGFIHILLVIALVVLLLQLISGRRPVV
jgi:predicted ferric reductase